MDFVVEDGSAVSATQAFITARDQLLRLRADLSAAQRDFRWPEPEFFNWALDYFDVIASGNGRPALRVVDDALGDQTLSFAELSRRSSQVANFLAAEAIGRGDRILIMLGNVVSLWETMLAAMKLGAVIIPATTLLERDELKDRLERGKVKAIITHSELTSRLDGLLGAQVRLAVGESVPGWLDFELSRSASENYHSGVLTRASDLLFLYFTSGTTARPKLVAHTHASYPIGHLSTMYWVGIRPGDVHLNLSSPGWAKHCLVVLLRSLERAGNSPRLPVFAIRRRDPAKAAGTLQRHNILRTTDGLANAHPAEPATVSGEASRGCECRRAAESRGHRARTGGVEPDDPRWFRTDRNDGPDRQLTGPTRQTRLNGTTAARLPGGTS